MNPSARTLLPLAALAVLVAACSDNESPPVEDHTPVSYHLEVSGVALAPPFTFPADQTLQVRIKFFNAAQEDLDNVEAEHFGGLSFSPPSLATAVRRSDRHYQFDVTTGTGGTGTLTVSFGHEEAADEEILDTAPVTISPTGGQ
jgi:hypothetical protein